VTVSLSRYDPSKSYPNQKSFDCGHKVINDFVARSLRQQTQRNLSVAYVLTENDDLFVGFCTLMSASITKSELAATQPPSLPGAVPVTKLAMLGVALTHARQGYGRQLLRHAIRVTVENANAIGSYGLYLDADNEAYDFYIKLAFVPLKARQTPNPTPMFLPLETARQAIASVTT
jgi:ribosomal protein S18 acetylase RimI-like enzyme